MGIKSNLIVKERDWEQVFFSGELNIETLGRLRATLDAENGMAFENAPIVKLKELSGEALANLFLKKISAIHISGYFSKQSAKRGDEQIHKLSKIVTWYIGPQNKMKTDMAYGIGIPRQQAYQSKKLSEQYLREALTSIRKVRSAFSPDLSPILIMFRESHHDQ